MTNTSPLYDIVAVGNAIVDVLSHQDDSFIAMHDLPKGGMQLIDAAAASTLYAAMAPGVEMSGGSAANTVAGIASLGGKTGFIGKVAADQLGDVFAHDLKAMGVTYHTAPLVHGSATARCLILVTPDAQRTMNTFLGASVEFTDADIDAKLIESAKILYLEGYLFDRPAAKQAFVKAAAIAHAAGRQVALTLSDSFCVERHRAEFLDLVKSHVDILFANEAEIISLYQADSFETALAMVQTDCVLVCLTRGAKGSVVVSGGKYYHIPARVLGGVVDTTGAGDLYAAGVLYGWTHGYTPEQCGMIGSLAAGEAISHIGARPQSPLSELVKTHLTLAA